MSDATPKPKRILWANVTTVISAAILIGTVLVGTSLATGWAIAGMLGLENAPALTIESFFFVGAILVVYAFVRKAISVEPFVER